MDRLIKFIISFITMNFLQSGTRGNMKEVSKQFLDIGITLNKVSKDGKITDADKDVVVQELKEFSDSVIKFLDDIKLPS